MPKEGLVKCDYCNWEAEVTLPDHKRVGWNYIWDCTRGGELPKEAAEPILKHHVKTKPARSIPGHRSFDVFLKDGARGEINATSYVIVYKELENENGHT